MIDIISQSGDIGLYDTQTMKAANILSVQLGSLEYEPTLGIDLKFFLDEDYSFQNESFRAYLIEILANNGVNVSTVIEVVENLYSQYTFNISSEQNNTALISR